MPVKTGSFIISQLPVSGIRYWVILIIFALLTACASTNTLPLAGLSESGVASEDIENQDHEALAGKYENLAAEMQAKVQEQREILEKNVFPTHFGKTQRSAKSRIEFKIRQYEQAAEEYDEKAAFHKAMAHELAARESVAESKTASGNMQLEKAKIISSPENTGQF
ncbi:MAG: hypothetical protein KF908_00900 [Nitrosomonas sp.]|nr:hypothetical protein [Nitrosomonas sp.]MCW5606531.1 hypothetical protein [Nitrosomonas sp.]